VLTKHDFLRHVWLRPPLSCLKCAPYDLSDYDGPDRPISAARNWGNGAAYG
jgi:hypothetical protein